MNSETIKVIGRLAVSVALLAATASIVFGWNP